jgi:diacylglycerol kinase (ATP)
MKTQETQEQKSRRGLSRVWHALGFSLEGLKAGWFETAFRQESLIAVLLIPSAFYLGQNWVEVTLLIGSVLLVMVVELLNTAIESAIDRVGADWHALSKRAKDLGSAAVLLALLLCVGVWVSAVWHANFWPLLHNALG